MKFHLLLMLPFVLIPSVVISESAPSKAQLALLGEEYNTMRQMRYRLKELLEQQEFTVMRTCFGLGDWGIISAMPRLLKDKFPECKVYLPSKNLLRKLFGDIQKNWSNFSYP